MNNLMFFKIVFISIIIIFLLPTCLNAEVNLGNEIKIISAEHLDENRNFITNIYDEVKELDDVWSERINDKEYVRVTFSEKLNKRNDITIYPKIVDGVPKVEVYEIDGSEIVAEFRNIKNEEYNQVLLTNLLGEQDSFDLRILEGSLQFDQIIDPHTQEFFEDCTDLTAWASSGNWEADKGLCEMQAPAGGANETLTTNSNFDLSSYTNAYLNFTRNHVALDDANDVFIVYVNSSDTDWQIVFQIDGSDGTANDEVDETVDVLPYLTSSQTGVHIRARCDVDARNDECNWDNINLSGYTPPADETDPEVNLLLPADGTNQSSTTVEFNCSMQDTGDGLKNSTLFGTWAGGWHANETQLVSGANVLNSTNFTKTIIDGTYLWNCYVCDDAAAGNCIFNSTNWTFTVDSIAPAISIVYPSNSSNTTNQNLDVNYTVSDSGTGLQACKWSNDSGASNKSLTCGNNITGQTWDQGSNTVIIYVNDSVGNENSSSVTFTLDSIAPSLSIVYPPNSTNTTDSSINVNYTVSDGTLGSCKWSNDSGASNKSLTCGANITGQSWDEGSNTVTVWANDSVGNENSSSVTFTLDTTPPYFQHAISNFELTNGQSFDYDVNATDAGVGLQAYAVNDTTFQVNSTGWIKNNSALGISLYYINISINDSLGNSNSSVFYVNMTDQTPPQITILSPLAQNYSSSSIDFNVSSNEDLSFCRFSLDSWSNNVTMTLNNSLTGAGYTNSSIGDGTYTAEFWCNDTSNNINNTENVSFSVDVTSPLVTIDSPLNQTYSVSSIEFNTSLNEAGYCEYSLTSGITNYTMTANASNTGFNATNSSIGDGAYTVVAYCNDSVGNKNYTENITFSISTDSTPPNISIVYPSDNANTTDDTLNVNYTVSGDAQSCWYSNDTYTSNASITCGNNLTTITWTEGQHNVTIWAEDSSSNENESSVAFFVDTSPPYFTAIANQSLYNNESLSYDVNASDGGVGVESYAINWTSVFDINSVNGLLTNISTLNVGLYYLNVSVNDTLGNSNSSLMLVNVTAVPDNEYPVFSSYQENPLNNSEYVSGQPYWLNVTITSTNGTAGMEFDGTNYSATNLSDIFNVTRSDLAAGTYLYYWWAYGNGTSENYNFSSTRSYVVAKATPTLTFFANGGTSNLSLTYPQQVNISAISDYGTVGLDKDNEDYLSNNALNVTLGGGSYIFRANVTGNQNYSDVAYSYYNVTINKASQSVTPLLNGNNANLNIVYPQQINASYSGTNQTAVSIDINGSSVNIAQNYTWGAGGWVVNYSVVENQNYSLFETSLNLTINKTTGDITLLLNGAASNLTIQYPQQSNITSSTSYGTVTIYKDGGDMTSENADNVTRAAGHYNITATSSGDQNYSSESLTYWLNITKGGNSVTLLLNGQADNLTVQYPQQVNASASSSQGTTYLFRDDSDKTSENSLNVTLGVGYYTYKVNATGDQNYSDNSTGITFYANVTRAASEVNLTLNSTEGNITVTQGTTILLNGTLVTGDSGNSLKLYNNGSVINEAVTEVSNSTAFNTVGFFNITVFYSQSQNYSLSFETYYVNVTAVPDTTAPAINITYPLNDSDTTNPTIDVNYTVGDLNLQSCKWSNDSGASNKSLTCGNNITGQSWDQGSNTIIVWANDTAGNENSSSVSLTLDSIAPSLSIVYPPDNTNSTDNTLNVNYTVDGAQSCWYSNDTYSSNTSITCGNNLTTITWAEGQHNVTIWANDTFDNENSSSVSFTVDSVYPLISFGQGTENDGENKSRSWIYVNVSVTEQNEVNITFLLWDSTSEINKTSYTTAVRTINWTGLADEAYTYNVTVCDMFNQCNTTDTYSITLDTTEPSLSIVYPQNISYTINVSELNYTSDGTTCWYSTSGGATNSSTQTCGTNFSNVTSVEGSNTWILYANDSFGNENSTNITFSKDTVFPQVSIVYPQNTTYTTNIFDLNYTFTEGAPDSCWYYNGTENSSTQTCGSNWSSIQAGEGSNTWIVYINDTSGNENSSSVTFFVDTVYPAISIVYPPNSTNTTDSSINVNYTLINGDVQACKWSNDSGANNKTLTCGNNITGQTWDQGSNTVIIYVNDTTGNENSSSVTFILDTTPPYFQHAISNFELTEGQSFDYDVNATDADVGLQAYAVNDTTFLVNSTGWVKNNSALGTSLYYINISINDFLGNYNSSVFYVNISDLTKPEITILSPLAQNYSLSSLDFNISSNENLSFCRFSLDSWSNNVTMTLNSSLTGAGYTNSSIGDGTYTAEFWCNDTSNNINNTETVIFAIDTTAPLVTIDFPLAQNYSSSSIDFNITLNEAGYCEYSLNSGLNNYTMTANASNTGFSATNSSIGDGAYTIIAYCNDSSGNMNNTETRGFGVDLTSPLISFGVGMQEDGVNVSANSVYVNVSVTEQNEGTIIFLLWNSTSEINKTSYIDATRTINWTGLADGIYTYNVSVNDSVGNSNTTDTYSITLDTTYPLISFGDGTQEEGVNVSANSVYVNVSVTETNFKNITFLLWNSTSEVDRTSYTDGTRTINWTSLSYVNHTYNVSVCDLVSQCNTTDTRLINLSEPPDTTSPQVTINFPIDGSTYGSSSVPLKFNISLNEEGYCEYSLNSGLNNRTMETSDNRTYNSTNSTLVDGSYTFSAYCNDTVGNRNYTESSSFTLDTSVAGPREPSGGGGGSTRHIVNFSIDKDLLDIKIKQGETKRENILIENTGDKNLMFNLEIQGLERFLILSEENFTLIPRESKEIHADFFVAETEPAGIHSGRIIVENQFTSLPITVVLEVKERAALFDIRSQLLDSVLARNQKLKAQISMEDIGDLSKSVDVTLEYFIEDFTGQRIKLEEETIGVYWIKDIKRKFSIPEGLEPGNYLFYVRLTYLDSIATSANRFTLTEEKALLPSLKDSLFFVIIIIVTLIFILSVFILAFKLRGAYVFTSAGGRYFLTNFSHKLYVGYLRMRYALYVSGIKRKAGLYDQDILTIKHLPLNIVGFFERIGNGIHVLYLRLIYRRTLEEVMKKRETAAQQSF